MLIDAHCHLNSLSKITREDVVSSFLPKGSHTLIDTSIDVGSSLASVALSQHYDDVFTSLGFHPFSSQDFSQEVIETYQSLINENKKIVAIGEIGLDSYAKVPLDKQEEVFKFFLRLAKCNNLPVIIHNRNDEAQVLDILAGFGPSLERVVFHCFSYSSKMLKKIVEKGGFISFSLNILRKSEIIHSSLRACPLENLILETDSPYMKIKNSPSTPLDIDKVYKQAATIKEADQEKLIKQVALNVDKVFSLNSKRSN